MNRFPEFAPTQTPAERREAAEREKLIRSAERQKLLASLKSPKHDPKDRIRLWEQLFGIHLPQEAGHRLIGLIATQTALTENAVHLEQMRRRDERGSSPAPQKM